MSVRHNENQELQIEEILNPDCDKFREAVRIYLNAFPLDERMDTVGIERFIMVPKRPGHDHFWVLLWKNEVVGMAMFSYLAQSNLGFGYYLAVKEEHRNKGIGSWMLQQMRWQVNEDAQASGNPTAWGVCGEVERVADGTTETERTLRARRISSYKRHGGICLPVDYLCRPMRKNGAEEWYTLMLFPANTLHDGLGKAQVRDIILAILLDIYEVPFDSKYVTIALNSLNEVR